MYNNFSSKKTKKVISALLASALVVTSAPITADAATTSKVLGVKKTFTVAGTKVTGLSKAEKKVVKVTIKNKKVTVKGLKAGKVTFKIGKKAYTVKVGATKVALTPAATSLKVNEKTKVAIVASNGKNDKLTVKTSNNSIVKISKSSVTANASGKASITLRGLAAGTSKITVTSKNTGKTASVKIKVVADEVVTQAPVVSDSPVVSENPSESQAPVVSGDPSTSQAPATSNDPNASQAPVNVTGGAVTITTNVTGASIQILSDATVVASASNTTVTSFVSPKLANGTYTVVVKKDGYVDATTTVVVNGDTAVSVTLKEVENAEIVSIKAINPNKYEKEYEALDVTSELPSNAYFSVKFAGVMDSETLNINNIKLYEVKDNVPAGVAKVTLNKTKTSAIVVPASLKKSTEYKLIFTSNITSEKKAKLTQKEYTFKTSAEGVIVNQYVVDAAANFDRAITVNSDVYFAGTNSAAEKDDVFYIELDSTADAGSINSDTVVLRNLTDNTTVNIRAELLAADLATTGTNNASLSLKKNKAVKITLLDNLKMKKNYRIEMQGVRLANGGKMTTVLFPFVTDSLAPAFNANQTLNGTSLVTATSEDTAVRVNGKLIATNLPTINTPEAGFGLIYNLSNVTDNASVTAEAFALTDVKNNKNIPFTFTYDEALKQVKIVPVENLPENSIVKITTSVDYKIKNTLGLSMAEQEWYVKTYDLTAPTVTNVEGETTNLKVGAQHKIKVSFSEEIGDGVVTTITDRDLSGFEVNAAGQKLDGTHAIAIVKAGVDPTEALAAGDFIKIDSLKRAEDKKSIELKFTPSVTDIGKTFQLVITGKNDENRMFICDFANGTGVGKVANPLASDYKLTLTTELQDVTGPVVESIGTIDTTETASVNDDSKFTAFTDGAHNIDATKSIAVRFNEQLTLVGTTFSTANGTDDATGNVVLEKYDYADSKWKKVSTIVGTDANVIVDSVNKKDALYINAAKIDTDSKYRLTITPSLNNGSAIKDKATDPNTMGTKYSVEFTTGEVAGLAVNDSVVVADKTNALSVNGLAPASVGATVLTNKTPNDIDNVSGTGDVLAIELSDGSFMFTTQVGATDTANDKITINDALTKSVKEGAKLYNLSKLTDGVIAQYQENVEKDEPILVKITSNTEQLNADTIKDAVKLYKASDNSVVAADVTYYVAPATKNTAWVSINPTADLEASTNYYVKVDGLKDRLGNEQSSDSKKKVLSFKTAYVKKKASVSDFSVYDGQMNVGVKTPLTFKATDVTSFDDTKVTLTKDGGSAVAANVSYDGTTNIVTLTPNVPLTKNSKYTLEVGTKAFNKDGKGIDMDNATSISFQTGDAVKPAITSVKHIEAGASGLVGDRLIITLDSETSVTITNATQFLSYFTIENGALTGINIASAELSTDKKVVTVVYGSTLGDGDYISDGYTTVKATGSLVATGWTTGADDLVFSDGKVTVEK